MKLWLHRIERIVDSTIPFFLVILLILIVLEIFFHDAAEPYSVYIDWTDRVIIGVFIIDLIFKYIRVRNIPKFVRHYWLDILAVFPFVLFFRLFQEALSVLALEEAFSRGQAIFHESLEVEREASKIVQEAEKTGAISRTRFIARIARPVQRFPRLIKAIAFHERATGKHHPFEKRRGKARRKRGKK